MRPLVRIGMITLAAVAGAAIFYYISLSDVGTIDTFEAELAALAEAQAQASRPSPPAASPRPDAPLFTLAGHEDVALTVDFSPDRRLLASGSADRTIRLWDIPSRRQVACLRPHWSTVSVVRFSPGGEFLLSGSFDKTALLWSVETREIEYRYLHEHYVTHAAFLNEHEFVTCTYEQLQLWRVGDEKPRPQKLSRREIRDIAVSPRGEVAVAMLAGEVLLWDPATGTVTARKQRPLFPDAQGKPQPNNCYAVHFLKNGDLLISDREGIWHWNRSTDDVSFLAPGNSFFALGTPPDQSFFLASATERLLIAGLQGNPFEYNLPRNRPHGFAISPDHRLLAIGYGTIRESNPGSAPAIPEPIEILDFRSISSRPRAAPATRAARTTTLPWR